MLANVGMLVKPIDKIAYNTNNSSIVPNALFSHSDQAGQWQTSIPTGLGNTGWGGRMADLLQSVQRGSDFPGRDFDQRIEPLPDGAADVRGQCAGGIGHAAELTETRPARPELQQLLTFDNGLQLVQAANATLGRGVSYANALSGALAGATLATQFPAGNPLATQLQTVARIIKVRSALGLSRQIFFANSTASIRIAGSSPSRARCCSS